MMLMNRFLSFFYSYFLVIIWVSDCMEILRFVVGILPFMQIQLPQRLGRGRVTYYNYCNYCSSRSATVNYSQLGVKEHFTPVLRMSSGCPRSLTASVMSSSLTISRLSLPMNLMAVSRTFLTQSSMMKQRLLISADSNWQSVWKELIIYATKLGVIKFDIIINRNEFWCFEHHSSFCLNKRC